MHVFTYGTLMFPRVWQAVAGRSCAAVRGKVEGFAIYRVRDEVFPAILPATQLDIVQGVVYLDVHQDVIARLDAFEDDFYERLTVSVECDDGRQREAQAYVVPDERRHLLTDEHWSADEFFSRGDLNRFCKGFAGFQRLMPDSDR